MNALFGWMGNKSTQHKLEARFDTCPQRLQMVQLENAAVIHQKNNIQCKRTPDGFIAIIGHARLKTQSTKKQPLLDTIIESYSRLGPPSINQVEGHFLILIVLDKNQELFIAQDKLGTYPFFYNRNQQGLFFGNHLHAFNQQLSHADSISLDAVYHYLYYHVVPSPLCIYKNFSRLLPGHYLIYQNDRLKTLAYWHPTLVAETNQSFSEKKEKLHELVSSAIRQEQQGSVGAFLSGGIDSTSVLGFLTKSAGHPVDAFTIGFDAKNFDEVTFAKIAADKYKADHHIYYLQPKDIINSFWELQSSLSQPFGNASLVPAYFCAKMAKKHNIQTLYAGDGGDELFGGNTRYAKQMLLSNYHHIPKVIRKKLIEPATQLMRPLEKNKLIHKVFSYIAQANTPMPQRMETYNLLNRIGVQNILNPEVVRDINSHAPLQLLCHYYTQTDAKSILGKMLATDLKFTLSDNDLVKVRTACECAGVKVSFPLLSDALLQFALTLSDRDKVKGQQLRSFYKKAMVNIIPKTILQKSKHGFGLPYGLWMLEDANLKEFSFEHLNALKQRNWVQDQFLDKLLSEYLVRFPNYYGVMSWVLIMLEGWMQNLSKLSQNEQLRLVSQEEVSQTDLAF